MSKSICPHCGEFFAAVGDAFCPFCREDLSEPPATQLAVTAQARPNETGLTPALCENCGNSLREGFVICHYCGERFASNQDKGLTEEEHSTLDSTLDYYLVKIHHLLGVNLLGVLLLLVAAFGLLGSSELGARMQSRELSLILGGFAVLSSAALDIVWRLARGKLAWASRLFRPLEGGCILYIPVWLYVTGGIALVGLKLAI